MVRSKTTHSHAPAVVRGYAENLKDEKTDFAIDDIVFYQVLPKALAKP